MKLTPLAIGIMLGGLAAAPAFAQYPSPQPGNPPQATQSDSKEAPAPAANQPKVSKQASKALSDLQNAVNAKDTANIPALVAAAQAKVKTADDKFALAQFQLKAAVDANDKAAMHRRFAGLDRLGLLVAGGNGPAIFQSGQASVRSQSL